MPFALHIPLETAAESVTSPDAASGRDRPGRAACRLVLSGRVGVQQARGVWEALLPVLATTQAIELHAELLEEVDTSILQILCRFFLAGRLRIAVASPGFLNALERRGLQRFFAVVPAGVAAAIAPDSSPVATTLATAEASAAVPGAAHPPSLPAAARSVSGKYAHASRRKRANG